ncbi:hypothetical protein Q7P35_012356 [Cladosporium inversicolor]
MTTLPPLAEPPLESAAHALRSYVAAFEHLFADQLVVIFPCCWDHATELVAAAIETLQQDAPHILVKGHDQGNPYEHTLTSFLYRPAFLLSLSHLLAFADFLL